MTATPTLEQARPFLRFVIYRHRVWINRTAGKPAPWTDDAILQNYRFCNVYRELDKVTLWIRKNWSADYGSDPDLWFAMVVARLVNLPSSLNRLQPLPWVPKRFVDTMEAQAKVGVTVFGPAYIVSTNGHSMPKAQYLAELVLNPMWKARVSLRPQEGEHLQAYHARLMSMQGMGSFMAAQVVADIKNTPGSHLRKSKDWWDWAAPGPGSLRGLSRVLGRGAVRTGLKEPDWLAGVQYLRDQINDRFTSLGWDQVCSQDTQNCLCEFDKYERARLGEGKPKQKFPGAGSQTELFK